jgi:hypothetical protein
MADDDLDDDDENEDGDGVAPWASAPAAGGSPGVRGPGGAPARSGGARGTPRRPGGTGTTGGGDIENVTRRVVDRYTCEGFMFTALDISNSVKSTLPGVRHREVAPIVRDLFSEGAMSDEYAQTLIDVQTPAGQTVQAFLYHLADDDPDDYAGTQRRQRAIPPVPIAVLMQAGAVATEVTVELGKDGRARIPRDFLERAGLTSGQVHVESTGSPTVLRLCEPADATAPAMLTLGYSHPTLFYLPTTLLAGFDLTRPIRAKVASQGVTVEQA